MDSFSNITQRKRVPSNLQQSKSMTDLSNSHIFDSTMTSLPSTSLDVSQSCCEVLKAEINQLTGELQSANNEIDSLHEENRNLKCELLRCQKIINVYKKLDFVENSPKTSSRKSKRNKLHDSNRESVCLQYNTPEKCIQVPIEEITCTPLVENSDEKMQKDRNSQNGDNMCTLVKNNLEQAHEKESSRTRSPKEAKQRKLCVLSNSTQRANPAPWSAFRSSDYGYTRFVAHNKTHVYMEQVNVEQNGQVIDSLWLVKNQHKPYDIK